MPKGLLIKGTTHSLIPYTEEAAKQDRFEVIPDVAAYLKSLEKPARKKVTRKKVKPAETRSPAPDNELDELLQGIDTGGQEDSS